MAEQKPPNDLSLNEALMNISVKDVKKKFIYPEQPQSGND
jgi:hypothetical protein